MEFYYLIIIILTLWLIIVTVFLWRVVTDSMDGNDDYSSIMKRLNNLEYELKSNKLLLETLKSENYSLKKHINPIIQRQNRKIVKINRIVNQLFWIVPISERKKHDFDKTN